MTTNNHPAEGAASRQRKPVKPEHLPADFNPAYATPDEIAAYARISRRGVERKMRDGTYESFLISPNKRVIVFASVRADIERRRAAGPQFDREQPPGRGTGARGRRRKAEADARSLDKLAEREIDALREGVRDAGADP
jgi:hypothetical protein